MKYVNGRRTGLVTFCVETAFYNGLLKERYKGGGQLQKDKEEDVGSYWMTLRKGEERILSFERGSSGSHYVESSFWKRLWTCRKTDC